MNQDMSSAPAPAPLPQEPKKSTNTGLIIGIVVVVLLCCCLLAIGGYVLWTNGDQWFGTGMLGRPVGEFLEVVGWV